MSTKINGQDLIFIDPGAMQFLNKRIEISQPLGLEAQWQTPAVYLAQKIASNHLVRFIGEKVQSDYLQTIVVIDDDPEELLNEIFSIEQEMYRKFEGLRFDVRVRVISTQEDIEVIKKSSITRHDRDII